MPARHDRGRPISTHKKTPRYKTGIQADGSGFVPRASTLPMLSERYGMGRSVMPVWHDVHRTRDATFLADETRADRRPGQVLWQRVQPDIDHATIATAARTLDVAGYVTVGEPFRRAAGRVCTCPSCVSTKSSVMIPRRKTQCKLSIPWGSERCRATTRRGS
jgi:hypothetical protein